MRVKRDNVDITMVKRDSTIMESRNDGIKMAKLESTMIKSRNNETAMMQVPKYNGEN